jgi:hypothetical protein
MGAVMLDFCFVGDSCRLIDDCENKERIGGLIVKGHGG